MNGTALQNLPTLLSDETEASALMKALRDSEALPGLVATTDPATLTRLIRKVGLDESQPLVEFMTPEQLRLVLSQDLWHAKRGQTEESFDIRRALRWMTTWLDISPSFLIDKVEDAGKNFLAVIILNIAYVYRIDVVSWNYLDVTEDDRSFFDDADSHFRTTYGDYNVVGKKSAEKPWRQLNEIIDALWHEDADFMNSVLDLCSNRTEPYVGDECRSERDGAGEAEDFLRDELQDSRNEERERAGFVLFQKAVENLHAARRKEILLGSVPSSLDSTNQALAATGDSASAPSLLTLHRAMQNVTEEHRNRGADLQREIAQCANTLMSGGHIHRRRFEEQEALNAVMATAALGLDYIVATAASFLSSHGREEMEERAVTEQGILGLFETGIALLFWNVSVPAARFVDAQIHDAQRPHGLAKRLWSQYINKTPDACNMETLIRAGRFREADKALESLEMAFLISDFAVLNIILSEIPLLPLPPDPGAEKIPATPKTRFVNNTNDIEQLQQLLLQISLD